MSSSRKHDIQFLLNGIGDTRAADDHAGRNHRRPADGNHSPRLGAGSVRHPTRVPNALTHPPRHPSSPPMAPSAHPVHPGGGFPGYGSGHDMLHSTRKKMADPRRVAMDPEAAKRKYICSYPGCGCRFKQKGDLKKHVRVVHHNERNFICSTCNKSFGEKGNLNKHIMSVHQKLRPFNCSMCPSTYASADSLRRHERIHLRRNYYNNLM